MPSASELVQPWKLRGIWALCNWLHCIAVRWCFMSTLQFLCALILVRHSVFYVEASTEAKESLCKDTVVASSQGRDLPVSASSPIPFWTVDSSPFQWPSVQPPRHQAPLQDNSDGRSSMEMCSMQAGQEWSYFPMSGLPGMVARCARYYICAPSERTSGGSSQVMAMDMGRRTQTQAQEAIEKCFATSQGAKSCQGSGWKRCGRWIGSMVTLALSADGCDQHLGPLRLTVYGLPPRKRATKQGLRQPPQH